MHKILRFIKRVAIKIFRIDKQFDSLFHEISSLHEISEQRRLEISSLQEIAGQQGLEISSLHEIAEQQKTDISRYMEQIEKHTKMVASIHRITDYVKTADSSYINGLIYEDLFCVCDILGTDIYKHIMQNYFRQAERSLSKCEKIQVGFMFTLPHTWGFDSLYREMEKHELFEPYVIVMPPYDMPDNYTYDSNIKIVREKKYRIIETFDPHTNQYLPFSMLKQLRIVFHQIPYSVYPKPYAAEFFPISTLNVYVTYGITNTNIKALYHNPAYRCYWKNLTETELHINVNRNILELGDFNAVRCGIPRLDPIYNGGINTVGFREKKPIYSIIWAPHHALPGKNQELTTSTFDLNKDFFLEYATNHPQTYWYVRPHPLLCSRSVRFGLFKDVDEYNAYFAQWDALDNAELAQDLDSLELFALSDMMITDCVSFMTDYMFFEKPLLRLNRGGKEDFWNEYGRLLTSHVTTVRGDDFEAIKEFIRTKPPMDKAFFDKYLNYYKQNGNKTAAEYFVNYIEEIIGGD